MKNKFSYMLFGLYAIMFLAVSCKEYVALEYENDPAIYFVRELYGQQDSLQHSFLTVPGDGPDTVYVDIRTMGYLSDQDRPFSIIQTNSSDADAAVAGVHYVPFDDERVSKYFTIPANNARRRLPIILLRDKSLDVMRVRLELSVAQNEYFRPGIDKWRKVLVTTTSQASKPATWDLGYSGFFGVWGPVKMKFIVDVTGFTSWGSLPSDINYITYLKTKVKSKLQEYNDAHPDDPLTEADGTTLVTFPA